ncbi:thioredoxin-like domain-containing protein [Pontimicrobium sp. SW4]|uniref:Thioredoxin-like domain-containing protein n=1 Tax=Pontimicrobium sp. SW4 TaxID=3153519 RepID=A0AAU7BTS5_9FLAO
MLKKTTLLILIISLLSCQSKKKRFADLNLHFTSNLKIDSVFISNITQDREFQFLPFSNKMHIEFNDSINDLYNINFYTEKGLIMNQMWLNGNQVTIKGSISNKITIDTVIGSNLYYKSTAFKKKYKKLVDEDSLDSSKINLFLLEHTKNNVNNPLSIEISNHFFLRNINNKKQLNNIYTILTNQPNDIKVHLLNPIKKIENILTDKKIDFSKHTFYDDKNNLVNISLDEAKTYLIDFWFVNCPPCVKDHMLIAKKLKTLKQNNIELISISTDNDHNTWIDYLRKNNYNWSNFREIENYNNRITTKNLITVFPTYLVIKKGNILKRSHSFSFIEEYLSIK